MIGWLKGRLMRKQVDRLLLDVRGVGYEVNVGERVYTTVSLGDEIELEIYSHMRESETSLYGFLNQADKDIFSILLSVSGVGPKSAMTIVGRHDALKVRQAIANADVQFFTEVPGIGKKGAQRILVDSSAKIKRMKELNLEDETGNDELVEALVHFGYSRQQVHAALGAIDRSQPEAEVMKVALRQLGKQR